MHIASQNDRPRFVNFDGFKGARGHGTEVNLVALGFGKNIMYFFVLIGKIDSRTYLNDGMTRVKILPSLIDSYGLTFYLFIYPHFGFCFEENEGVGAGRFAVN